MNNLKIFSTFWVIAETVDKFLNPLVAKGESIYIYGRQSVARNI